MISKQEYEQYEQEIIDKLYYEQNTKTDLIPTNGKPSVLKCTKVILILDFVDKEGKSLSTLTQTQQTSKLPIVSHIPLYHIGNKNIDTVKMGYDSNKELTFFPGADFGGLTNYRQEIGTKSDLKLSIKIKSSTAFSSVLGNIYDKWKHINRKKKLYGNVKKGLGLFIKSLIKFLKSNPQFSHVNIRFWKIPTVRRLVYTSYDIHKLMGKYYIRVYGKGDSNYAKKIKPSKDIFCYISKTTHGDNKLYITPNINRNNLLNEYVTY